MFLHEPDVVSPVAMEFDENGDIYVVEDRGYPLQVKEHMGRVKMLRDTNNDGVPDRTTIFAENLVMPTGVMRWKKASSLPTRLTFSTSRTPTATASPTCVK